MLYHKLLPRAFISQTSTFDFMYVYIAMLKMMWERHARACVGGKKELDWVWFGGVSYLSSVF